MNRGMRRLALAGVLVLAWMPGRGRAAGIRDMADGWLFGPAAAVRLMTGRPAAAEPIWVALGSSRLYGLSELPVVDLTLGLRGSARWGWPSLQLGWQTLGQGLYREDERRFRLQWGRRLVVGGQLRSLAVRTGGEAGVAEERDSFWQATATLQTAWELGAEAGVQLRLELPLAEAAAFRIREGRRRLLAVQGWHGPAGFAAVLDTKADQTPTVGMEWLLAWGGAVWGARVEPAVGVVGLVFAWRRGRLLFRTSHLAHPQLGITHRFQVGVGLGGGSSW